MAKLDQSFGEEGDDALGATIELGRNRLVQRRNLRDLHLLSWPEQPGRTAKRAYNDKEACWFAFVNELLHRNTACLRGRLERRRGTAPLPPR